MSYEERNAVISIIVTILGNGYIFLRLRDLAASGAFDGPDALQLFARTVLWIIPICIVLMIVATILFNILFAIVTLDENPDFTTDERDKAFQARGMMVTMVISSFGFIGALIALALGRDALFAFVVLYAVFVVGSFIGDMTKLVSYRVGG